MKDLSCDVLVVGGGPSGSIAAKYAAHGGADVIMIEKRQDIGSPVRCGEGIAKRWIDEVRQRRPAKPLILDMDSSVNPNHGARVGSAYNGYFGCNCYTDKMGILQALLCGCVNVGGLKWKIPDYTDH